MQERTGNPRENAEQISRGDMSHVPKSRRSGSQTAEIDCRTHLRRRKSFRKRKQKIRTRKRKSDVLEEKDELNDSRQ